MGLKSHVVHLYIHRCPGTSCPRYFQSLSKIAQESERVKSHICFRLLSNLLYVWHSTKTLTHCNDARQRWGWGGHEKQLLFGWLFSFTGITLTFYPHSLSHAASASPCPCLPAGLVLQSDWCTLTHRGLLFSAEAGTPRSQPLNTNHTYHTHVSIMRRSMC